MNKRILRPEDLRVESFSTHAPTGEAQTAAERFARTNGPGCFPTHDRTCTC